MPKLVKLQLKASRWSQFKCFLGIHRQVEDTIYRSDSGRIIDSEALQLETEKLRGTVRRCGYDKRRCQFCDKKWIEKWSMF